MPRILLVAALAVLTAGCETFVEADPAGHDPLLTTTLRFAPGQPWSLVVSRTVALGDTTAFPDAVVTDASVTITSDDGTVLVLPHIGDGRYGAAPRPPDPETGLFPEGLFEDGPAPEVGRTYTLRIEAPGFPPATATSRAPLPAAVQAEVVGGWEPTTAFDDTQFYSDAEVSVRIAPAGTAAYYAVSISDSPLNPGGLFSSGSFYTAAPLLEEATFVSDFGSGPRQRQLSAFIDLNALAGAPFVIEVEQVRSDTLGISVLAASPAFFEEQRQSARRRAAETNPFAEPVPPYSNLDGGVGLFAGTTNTLVEVYRPD